MMIPKSMYFIAKKSSAFQKYIKSSPEIINLLSVARMTITFFVSIIDVKLHQFKRKNRGKKKSYSQ